MQSQLSAHSRRRLIAQHRGSVANFVPTCQVKLSFGSACSKLQEQTVTISFKGAHFPKEVILYAVFFYLRYGVSYRDLEEIMAECGVKLDHATLNRWVSRYAGLLADAL